MQEKINKNTKFYDSSCEKLRFLLGGIGTGTISLGARGNFEDFEIFNEPKKGFRPPNTFFILRYKQENQEAKIKVLESNLKNYEHSSLGYEASSMAGLPRFKDSKFYQNYPFANVDFIDKKVPLKVKMVSFNPFVPLDSFSSGLPIISVKYEVENISDSDIDVSVAGSISNLCGYEGEDDVFNNIKLKSKPYNKDFYLDNVVGSGVEFLGELEKTERYYNELSLFGLGENVTLKPEWLDSAWQDSAFEFLQDFKDDGKIEFANIKEQVKSCFDAKPFSKTGSVCINDKLKSGEKKEFEFLLSWYSPNRYMTWFQDIAQVNKDRDTYKNYYAYRFDSAKSVVNYYLKNKNYLEDNSKKFSNALYSSDVPKDVIDSVSGNISVLRSTTCFRAFESGKFYGFEGSSKKFGFCDGNCSHVYNYNVFTALFFPDLERCMRKTEFITEIEQDGHIPFRVRKDFNDARWDLPAAVDGQLGSIIRVYREWKISKDDDFLIQLYDNVKLALDYCINLFDSEKTGLLSGLQHNTYDIEFYGNTSMLQSVYVTALKSFIEITKYLDKDYTLYKDLYLKSVQELDKLYDGEYYYQKIDDVDKYKYQYGKGCLSDQLFGIMLAKTYGLEVDIDKNKEKKALKAIFKYNFKKDFYEHENLQRVYALNDDSGLLLCSFPKGGRPILPFVYADEVWTGIEYQVAAHMAYAGLYDKSLKVVQAVRDRYNGKKRNPFAEQECGYHYIRSLSSYAVFMAFAGTDLNASVDSFKPYKDGEFETFYIDGNSWGIMNRDSNGDIIKNHLYKK